MADELTLPASKRELALDRSQRVSRALQDAARKARLSVRGNRGGGWQSSSRSRAGRSFALGSALLVFVLPTLGGAVYYGFLASDQYLVEAQFAVKARSPEATDLLGKMSGLPALQQAQDALVVVDYMSSRSIVEKLDASLDLRAMYTRPEVTFLDRFHPDDPIEALTRYWRKMVNVTVNANGIIVMRLRAYRADDALKLGETVLRYSEQLINDMSLRQRRDAVASGQQEVDRAEKRLVELREQLRTVRDREGVLDPKKAGEALLLVLAQARGQKIKLEDEVRVQRRVVSADAPQVRVLTARLEAMNAQIAKLEGELTATSASGTTSLSRSQASYDKATLDQTAAEKVYAILAASLEKSRMEASRQQVFIESFVEPVLPQEPEFPRRLWNTFLVGLASFGAWFGLSYVRSAIKG